MKIRNKYQDRICDGVKNMIKDALDEFIDQSIEQNRIIEGIESLEKWKQ